MSLWTQQIAMALPAQSGTQDPQDWFVRAVGGVESDAGVRVTADSAMTLASWWQAIQIISGDVAALPLKLYQWVDERTKVPVRKHPAYRVLNRRFHNEITPFDGREAIQACAQVHGNGLAYIDRSNRRLSLTPLDVRHARTERQSGRLVYLVHIDGKERAFLDDEMFHIKGLGLGVWGHSVVDHARNSIGMGLALQKHGSAHFRNGARPSGLIKSDRQIDPKDRAPFREEFEAMHRGPDNQGRVAILPPGMSYEALSMTNEDAQWLESMRFSREEVAAWHNLPPHKLGALENSSVKANLEAQNRSYIETTLERWLRKWEQECERKLLTEREYESGDYFFRFNLDARLRGDIKTRTEAQVLRVQNGIDTPNEVRISEDKNPVPHGDRFIVPLNMAMVDEDGNVVEPRAQQDIQANASLERALKHRTDALLRTEAEQLRRCGKKGPDAAKAVQRFYRRWAGKVREELSPFATAESLDALAKQVMDELQSRESEIGQRLAACEAQQAEGVLEALASHLGDPYAELRTLILEAQP